MKYNIKIKNPVNIIVLSLVVSLLFSLSADSYGQNKKINSENEISELISKLEEKNPKSRQAAVVKIYDLGKQAIPELISNITNGRSLPFLLKNPRNSTLSRSQLGNSSGLISAYLIEFILGREKFSIINNDNGGFIFGSSENYIYWQGIIEDSKGKVLDNAQLNEIKVEYENWWFENSGKSIESLRKQWKEGKTPLDKSDYKWR